jgi:arylsulfatase
LCLALTIEHGLSEKWYAFDQSVQVPLVIQDPRMPAKFQGTKNHEYTLSVDLAPTMLSAARIPVPSVMQGRDMAELYLNPSQASKSWRKDFFYEWTQGRNEDGEGHGAVSLLDWYFSFVFVLTMFFVLLIR